MKENYLLGIAVVPWILDDTINRVNSLGNEKKIIEKRRNSLDPVAFGTLNFFSNTTGKGHGVIEYNPYYFKWNPDILKYGIDKKKTGALPKIKENKVINKRGSQ